MENDKKPKKIRSGFLAVKLTDEALDYFIRNNKSLRLKASLAYLLLGILGWMTWVGQTQPSSKGFAFSLLAFVFIMAMIIYKWPKTGFRIALFVFIINTLIVVLYQPENIIGGIIGLYIFLFFLYPAYQIEKTIKSKNTDVEDDNKTTKLKDKKTSYIFCQNCGKKNVNEANYCKKCGNKIIK